YATITIWLVITTRWITSAISWNTVALKRLPTSIKPVSAKSFASTKTGKHGLFLMKLKQGQNVYAPLKSLIASVAKRVTSSIKEGNLAGKPLSDNGSMPEFVSYVDAKKPTYMRFTLYGTLM